MVNYKNRVHILKKSLSEAASKIILPVAAALFPQRCPVCDEPVRPFGALICSDCAGTFKEIKEPTCFLCGKALSERERDAEYCRDCAGKEHFFDRAFGVFEYRSMAPSLYRFKYKGRREYAKYYADSFIRKYSRGNKSLFIRTAEEQRQSTEKRGKILRTEHGIFTKSAEGGIFVNGRPINAMIPVPLGKKRLEKRGYNQAEEFSRAVSLKTGVPVASGIVKRVKNTRPMKELNYYERRNNLKNAFIIAQNDVSLESVAIVDDIYTTGSTADALASLLKKHGVRFVYVFTIATGR